ncbi:MAG TPA: hypothetical protein PLH37_00440 [bacterium]|nr:hypothetical protein [bacterium]
MNKNNKKYKKIAKLAGFLVGYFLFTTVLYFILAFSNNLSQNSNYYLIMIFVMLISLFGFGLKYFLK